MRITKMWPRSHEDASAVSKLLQQHFSGMEFENTDLLATALKSLGSFDQVRVLAFFLSLAQSQNNQLKSAYLEGIAAERAAPRMRVCKQKKSISGSYNFRAATHEGPELREALFLSERGFYQLKKRERVWGKRFPGKSTIYTRKQAEKLRLARELAMSEANREKLRHTKVR